MSKTSEFFTNNKRKLIWVGLGVVAILIRVLLGFSPALTEQLYSRGLFVGIRVLIDYTLGWIPFPMVFVVLSGLLVFLFFKIKNLIRTHQSFRHSAQRIGMSLLSFLFGVIFFFLVLWGYNYGRMPIEKTLGIDPAPLEFEELEFELELNTQETAAARKAIPNISEHAITEDFLPQDLENEIRQDVENLLEKLNFPIAGVVRGRMLQPKGILLRFSTAGVYFPWTGESNVDAGLHPIQIPFTLAHEFAHGYGFTDEGTCNFLAYLACIESENKMVQYSGHLSYWRYLASSFRRFDREKYSAFFKTLPRGIVADLYAIDENGDKYPDILPELRDLAYDTYLKSQGIKEGMKSYSRIVMLVKAWRDK